MAKRVVTNPLKIEWDQHNGKITRVCKVCGKEFSPLNWNQILCSDDFCKQGSKLYSHLQASLRRWNQWKEEAKSKDLPFVKDK